jgi:hypothetical protein
MMGIRLTSLRLRLASLPAASPAHRKPPNGRLQVNRYLASFYTSTFLFIRKGASAVGCRRRFHDLPEFLSSIAGFGVAVPRRFCIVVNIFSVLLRSGK